MAGAVNEDDPINYKYIPQHLITAEILVRLPVESLLRFKSVCKEWNSIISSRYFVELHLNFSKSKPSYDEHNTLFVCAEQSCDLIEYKTINNKDIQKDDDIGYRLSDNWYPVLIPEFPLIENQIISEFFRSECLLDSCNGLVCFYIEENFYKAFFYIWNPYTNHFTHVFSPNNFRFYITVAGFFYIENDYKIVAFGSKSPPYTKWGGVYSLNTNLWTEIPLQNLPFDIGLTLDHSYRWLRGVKVNEMLYWKTRDHGEYHDIIGFNIKDYTFRQLLPSSSTDPEPYWCNMILSNIGGSLCSCCRFFRDQLKIWKFEYKENSSEVWTLMFKLNLEGFEKNVSYFVGFTKDGKIIAENSENFELLVFNTNEDHTTVEPIASSRSSFEAIIKFNASLVSPCHYKKQDTEEEVDKTLYGPRIIQIHKEHSKEVR